MDTIYSFRSHFFRHKFSFIFINNHQCFYIDRVKNRIEVTIFFIIHRLSIRLLKFKFCVAEILSKLYFPALISTLVPQPPRSFLQKLTIFIINYLYHTVCSTYYVVSYCSMHTI